MSGWSRGAYSCLSGLTSGGLEGSLFFKNLLRDGEVGGQQANGFVAVAGAYGCQDGVVLLGGALHAAAQIERWPAIAAHAVHQRIVGRIEIGVVGPGDEGVVKGGIGGEEALGVTAGGVPAHVVV